jgi:uroporphyrinogen decarboxylase
VRAKFPNFLEFCYTPDAACEVTLQPIARFGMDAAIIFSDILVIPHALGQKVEFQENVGPVLEPLETLETLDLSGMSVRLEKVYQAITMTRAKLSDDKALIGFCGAPWTLAAYMINGRGSRDFQKAREVMYRTPEFFVTLMDLLTQAVSQHAVAQIDAGADVIQIFDSWSGVLSEAEFHSYAIAPMKKIVEAIKQKYPHFPVIGFPRMSGCKAYSFAKDTGVDAISCDGSQSLVFMRDTLDEKLVIQGNLDPVLLAENKELALMQAKKIVKTFASRPFIFNLSHGILPHTPISHVGALSDYLRNAVNHD